MWLSVDFKNREKQRRYITIKYKLKGRNCKALHLRPPDITPVILGFNYEARNVPATTSSDSAVTATELLQPLDLACETLFRSSCAIQASPTNCSDDSWRDTFFGKHEHGALWLLICGALEKHLLTNIAPTYQISGKSNSVQRGSLRFKYVNLGTVGYLGFDRNSESGFKKFCGLRGPKMHWRTKCQHNRTILSWVIEDSTKFSGYVCRGEVCTSYSQS